MPLFKDRALGYILLVTLGLALTVALVRSPGILLAGVLGFVCVVAALLLNANRHISERRRAERELRLSHETLERTVESRTADLMRANESLGREIAERTHAEEALRRSESFLGIIFDSIQDPVCIFDRDFRIVKANEEYARLKGRTAGEMAGKVCYELIEGRPEACDLCVVKRTFSSGDACAKEKKAATPEGSEVWHEIYTYPVFGDGGRVTHVIEYTRDITHRKLAERERQHLIEDLETLSRTDALTGLMNRRALLERLESEVYRARRYGLDLSVIICDIDRFKDINDTYGHSGGDEALRQVARVMEGMLRQADLAGRHGGDEFMVILPETDLDGAENFAERFRARVQDSGLDLPGVKGAAITISLGVAALGPAMEDANGLVKPADDALYASKQAGRNKVTASGGGQ